MDDKEKFVNVLLNAILGSVKVVLKNMREGDVISINVHHDESCPTLTSQNIDDCVCKPEIRVAAVDREKFWHNPQNN